VCPPGCGDDSCEPLTGENCANCPQDCTCGKATCQDAVTCAYGCNWDPACLNECVEGACYEAQVQVSDLLNCLQENCTTQCVDLGSTGCLACGLLQRHLRPGPVRR
jgi:hypothetical protein